MTSDAIYALYDDKYCEDYRLEVKMYKIDHNKGRTINVQQMLTALEKKYTNLVQAKKWVQPQKTGIDSKYMALLANSSSKDDKLSAMVQLIDSTEDQYLKTALTAFFLKDSSSKSNKKRKDNSTLKNLAAPENNGSRTKKVDNKIATYCDFCKKWSFTQQHTTERCYARKAAEKKNSTSLIATLASLSNFDDDEDKLFTPDITLAYTNTDSLQLDNNSSVDNQNSKFSKFLNFKIFSLVKYFIYPLLFFFNMCQLP